MIETPILAVKKGQRVKGGLALGVDAGGTYTDVVILDHASGRMVDRCKSPTTRHNPALGIENSLSGLNPQLLADVEMVSLATTFATNAIVEEVGARAGLILMGYEEVPGVIPKSTPVLQLGGGHTVTGSEKNSLDLAALARQLDEFVFGLDAVAVAGFFSIRNPDHENRVAQEIRTRYNLPVVRAHRLSMRLDAIKRATTCWWNARLIPLISNLIQSCQNVLKARGIAAPLMVVRGDGTLMSADTALDRPVDTLLSGPAASILGAKHLAGVDDCLIVDMGGTTTDMAILRNGKVQVDPQGARVGRWETHVEAAQVRTVGLGGDSYIQVNFRREISVGPRRVIPLCRQSEMDPRLIDMLTGILERIKNSPFPGTNPCSFFIKNNLGNKTRPPEIVSEYFLWADKNGWGRSLDLIEEEKKGLYVRSALTPTDLRVAAGQFSFGSSKAARLGRKIIAIHLGVNEKELSNLIEDWISRSLCLETVSFVSGKDRNLFAELLPRWYPLQRDNSDCGVDLDLQVTLTSPVVGVGAPAPSCLQQAYQHLNAVTLMPQGYDVSVAVGSVVGMVDRTFKGTIRLDRSGTYDLFTARARDVCQNLEEAKALGQRRLEEMARDEMTKNYVRDPLFEFKVKDEVISSGSEKSVYLQTDLTLRATGRPAVG
jgi:N-methylhydantoinase A/oxoprolinase/acetone carboxylase beta subunit